MKSFLNRKDFEKAIYDDIDYLKAALRNTYDNLDLIDKCSVQVDDFVLVKDTWEKGIVKGYSLESKQSLTGSRIAERTIYLHIVTTKTDLKVKLENVILYTDTAKLLYAKQLETQHYTPKITGSNDEIPF